MAGKKQSHTNFMTVPMLKNASLSVGIDVGKSTHVAGFVSCTLLERHERSEACPALALEQSHEGIRSLIDRIQSPISLEQVYVLLEQTVPSHRALVQYLQEIDLSVSIPKKC